MRTIDVGRSTRWTLVVDSAAPANSWRDCVDLLHAVTRAISTEVEKEYGAPLVYRDETLSPEEWADPETLAADTAASQLRDDEGRLIPDSGATSAHEGFLAGRPQDRTNPFLGNLWSANPFRQPHLWCAVQFYPKGSEARPLTGHSVEWLVDLVGAVVTACDAKVAWIDTGDLLNLLMEEDLVRGLGAVTYLPEPVDTSRLSAAFTTYPGPDGRGQILVADPAIATSRPEDLLDDFRTLDRLYRAIQTPA